MTPSIIYRKLMHKLDGYHRKGDNIINRVVLWINGVQVDQSVSVSGRIFIRLPGYRGLQRKKAKWRSSCMDSASRWDLRL